MTFKSLDDIKKTAMRKEVVDIELSDIEHLPDEKGLNSFLFTDPFSKICFTCSAVSAFLHKGNVIYVDLDTVFTSYVRNGIFSNSKGLLIYLPSANEFEEILADVCSMINSNTKLIVIDSINSFYHMYDKIKIGSLNHLLSSYVSLLLNHSCAYGSRLLVTSMIRHKRTTKWVLAPASKRLIESKSTVILRADLFNGNLAIDLVKHREIKGQKRFLLGKESIPIIT